MQNLDKPDLSGLHHQVNVLLQNLQQLKRKNNQLHQQLSEALHAKAQLTEKNKQAQEKIIALTTQLKENIA